MPSPLDLPDSGIKLGSPALQVDSLPTELSGKPKKESMYVYIQLISFADIQPSSLLHPSPVL